MEDLEWMALEQEDGRVFLVEIIDKMHKIKGIGAVSYTHLTLPTKVSV